LNPPRLQNPPSSTTSNRSLTDQLQTQPQPEEIAQTAEAPVEDAVFEFESPSDTVAMPAVQDAPLSEEALDSNARQNPQPVVGLKELEDDADAFDAEDSTEEALEVSESANSQSTGADKKANHNKKKRRK
jgi:hypothetical protein